ncbi:MAG TPA: gamma carbonic anhydrase family protein [Actinomycetota bacterium]|jgi:carbonic anhydrase/acetyltransferase-like protein (isoleucine patch superfamily)|nr:gamma carbonic anhydrase family protein [Actinomycetota bacterium]
MALEIEFAGRRPVVDAAAFVAHTAVLVGDVTVAAGASVWYGAVLRGDFGPIVVGAGSNVQDNCVLHAAEGLPTVLEDEVTVGHLATMEGCVIERGALIGMGAVVLQRARVGRGAVIAAGSVVAEDAQIPPGVLAAGVPAQVKRELSGRASQWGRTAAGEYQRLVPRYLAQARVIPPARSGRATGR